MYTFMLSIIVDKTNINNLYLLIVRINEYIHEENSVVDDGNVNHCW